MLASTLNVRAQASETCLAAGQRLANGTCAPLVPNTVRVPVITPAPACNASRAGMLSWSGAAGSPPVFCDGVSAIPLDFAERGTRLNPLGSCAGVADGRSVASNTKHAQ